jgi:hypothetical protein
MIEKMSVAPEATKLRASARRATGATEARAATESAAALHEPD